ncbi:MAG: PAS domain S-box protein [Myxococcaceae bacterium]|nr:MAG: PAS domain S-box protein [Myxococcaceae bacterium]
MAIVAIGVIEYRVFSRQLAAAQTGALLSAADLQSNVVRRHFEERRGDALLLSSRERVRAALVSAANPASRALGPAVVQDLLAATHRAYGYHAVQLFDPSVRLVAGVGDQERVARKSPYVREAIATRQPVVIPARLEADGVVEYGIVYPVFSADGARVMGAVALTNDARAKLVPLLVPLRGRMKTVSTAIVVRDGEELVYVGSAEDGRLLIPPNLRFSVNDRDHVVPRLARLRRPGVVRGLDLWGVEVVAAAHPVANTPYMVVVKVSAAELDAAKRRVAFATLGSAVLLLALIALAQRSARIRSERAATARALAAAGRYLAATESSMSAFLHLDARGTVIDANPAFEALAALPREALIGRPLQELGTAEQPGDVSAVMQKIRAERSARFTADWRRPDGALRHLDVSASYIVENGAGEYFAFIHDITSALETSRRIARTNRLYVLLSGVSEALFGVSDEQEAYELVCRLAVAQADLCLVWVGVVDESAGRVRPAAAAGAAVDYVRDIVVTTDPTQASGQGPSATAIREGRAVIVNDFAHDPRTAPWHGAARQWGLGASLSLPVIIAGRSVAAVMFYSADAHYFDDERVALLSEISRFLALVLHAAEANRRRESEAARRELSEARFRGLFEGSPVPKFVVDAESDRIVQINRAFTETYGYVLADLPTFAVALERFFPDPAQGRERQASWRQRVRRTTDIQQSVTSSELRFRCADGTERFVQGHVTRVGGELVIGWVDLTALRESQLLLSEAQEVARMGSWVYEFATKELHRSVELQRAVWSATGSARVADEAFGRLLPEDRPRFMAALARSAAEHTTFDETARVSGVDGRVAEFRSRARIVYAPDGSPVRAVGLAQDVTNERESARELERYRHQLEAMVEERTAALAHANQLLQSADRRLKAMLALSQRAATLDETQTLQLGIDEAVRLTGSGVGWIIVLGEDERSAESVTAASGPGLGCGPGDERDLAAGIAAEAARRREPAVDNERAGADVAADHVPLARSIAVPFVENERVRLVLVVGNRPSPYDGSDAQELELIGNDIWGVVQRRRAELAVSAAYTRMRLSEERLNLATEASAAGIWDEDLRSGVVTVSAAYATMLGYAPGELPTEGGHWASLIHPAERDRVVEECARRLREVGRVSVEFRMRAKDGSYRWVLRQGNVVERDARGEPQRIVGTHMDLTARRAEEDELRAAKEAADAASRAKSSFLATMSHEIRTPLNGVIAMAEVLSQAELSPRDRDAVLTIHSSANLLLSVIDDILDFSKIEAGRLELEISDASIHELVEELCASLLPLAQRKSVDLCLFVDPAVPAVLRTDRVRLRQVLYNLLGNAIKFSGSQPGLRGRVRLGIEATGGEAPRLLLRVDDNGVGMTEETIGRLFRPFSQGEASTTRRFGGSGLGLAITHRLVEAFGGSITVESAPGLGSTFTVALPLSEVRGRAVEPDPDLTGVACVVVEPLSCLDSEDLRRLLEYAGADVTFVASASEALAATAGKGAAVVLRPAGPEEDDASLAGAVPAGVTLVLLRHGSGPEIRVGAKDVVSLVVDVVRGRQLVRAVAVAAGRASPELAWGRSPEELRYARGPVLGVEEARRQGRLILVAEDDETNQKVIRQQLELLGYAVEVASDGRAALERWRTGTYAMLLTDLHMPVMDGYALAAQIRREEGGPRRLPIVALTANALRGEVIRTQAAGMDAHLTKPVPLATLLTTIERWTGQRAARPTLTTAPPSAPVAASSALLDVNALRALVGDDERVIRRLLNQYQTSAAALVEAVRAKHAAGDLDGVAGAAHKLKSSSRSVGAMAFAEACAAMERCAREPNAATVAARLPEMLAMFDSVRAEIGLWLSDPGRRGVPGSGMTP